MDNNKFQEKLNDILKTTGYLPMDIVTEEYREFLKIFNKDRTVNIEILKDTITKMKENPNSGTFAYFIEQEISFFENLAIENLWSWAKELLLDDSSHGNLKQRLLAIFEYQNTDRKNLEFFYAQFLSKANTYIVLESAYIDICKNSYIFNFDLHRDYLLKILNLDRGNFLGINWYTEGFVIVAQKKGVSFLEQLLLSENSVALWEFLDLRENSSREFFWSLPQDIETQQAVRNLIEYLIQILEDESLGNIKNRYFLIERDDDTHAFLTALFNYLNKAESSPILDILLPHTKKYWSYFAKWIGLYIQQNQISRLEEFVTDEGFYLVFEVLRILEQSDRPDKDDMIMGIKDLWDCEARCSAVKQKWIDEERKRWDEIEQRAIAAQDEIEKMALLELKSDQWIPYFIERYKTTPEYFSETAKQKLKIHLDHFFKSNPTTIYHSITTERAENGSSTTWGIPQYGTHFLSHALDTAIKLGFEVGKDIPREVLLKSFIIADTQSLKKIMSHIEITTIEAREYLRSIREERNDERVSIWGWQNIGAILEKYETTFFKKTVIWDTRKTLHSIITDTIFQKYERLNALYWYLRNFKKISAHWDKRFFGELFRLESAWLDQKNAAKYLHEYGELLGPINEICILLNIPESLDWRFNLLLNIEVNISDWKSENHDWLASIIGDWESEIILQYSFLKFIKQCDFSEVNEFFENLIIRAQDLLTQDSTNQYAQYLLRAASYIYELWNDRQQKWCIEEIQEIIDNGISIKANQLIDFWKNSLTSEKDREKFLTEDLRKQIEQLRKENQSLKHSQWESQTLSSLDSEINTLKNNSSGRDCSLLEEKNKNQALVIQDLTKTVDILKLDNQDLNKRVTELQEYEKQKTKEETPNLTIWTEGPTDIAHLKNAYEKLYVWKSEKLNIDYAQACNVETLGRSIRQRGQKDDLVVGIFDCDGAWIEEFRKTAYYVNNNKDSKCACRLHNINKIAVWWMLVWVREFNNICDTAFCTLPFLYNDFKSDEELEFFVNNCCRDKKNIDGSDITKQQITIETMYYWIDSRYTSKFFLENRVPIDKNNFLVNILAFQKKNPIQDQDLYRNFKILFDAIHYIYNEWIETRKTFHSLKPRKNTNNKAILL